MKKILIVLLILAIASPIAAYFYYFNGGVSLIHQRWSEFGSYLGGIYGTLAFVILAYTTNLTRIQFKIQNENNTFFKVCESIENRIISYEVVENNEIYKSHSALKYITAVIKAEFFNESKNIAWNLLTYNPRIISDLHYHKIFEAVKGETYADTFDEDKNNLINTIESYKIGEHNGEYIKAQFGYKGEESELLLKALRDTGMVNFYKISFVKRKYYYENVMERILNTYGGFLDGYFNSICYLFRFIEKSEQKKEYINFIKSQLTKYELVIIFYLAASKKINPSIKNAIYSSRIMDTMLNNDSSSIMFDLPSVFDLMKDIKSIFGVTN